MKTYVTVYFGTAITTLFLMPIVSRLAKKYRLVDTPGPRRVHQTPIPRIGGIVFIISTLALVLPVFFLNNDIGQSFREQQKEFIVLFVGAIFIFTVGLIDDLCFVRPSIKLLCLIGASLAICASGATLRSVSVGTWFELETGWMAWPLAIIWIITITVGMNFIDGLDGLAAGIAAIVCGTIMLLALWSGQVAMAVLMLALLGSVTSFLFFNFHPAKIFMGDGGSMFLGFLIGAGSLVCQAKTSALVGIALPFLVLGVPILDAGFTMIRRPIIYRRSIFASEKGHIHHYLLSLGLPQQTVIITIYAMTIVSASIGMFMLTMSGGWSVGLLVVGLVFLLSVFTSLGAARIHETIAAIKRNREMSRKEKQDKNCFEDTQLRMRDVTTFSAWWEALCDMAKKMQFQSIGVWNRHNDHYVMTHAWNEPSGTFAAGRTMRLTIPLHRNGITEWEIRARIWINGVLELSGHQAMLLARLMDEFPPPEQPSETMIKVADTQRLFGDEEIKGNTGISMAGQSAMVRQAHPPAPINVMGVSISPFESYDQALESIERTIKSGRKSFWVAINPQKCYRAWHDRELMDILGQADVGICDGVGMSVASKILHGQSIQRCTGCDLFFQLLSLASQKGWGVYLLGASPESNAGACAKLREKYPGLRIVGRQDGYFKDSRAVVKRINASKAKLLFVAMGSPKQEYWIWRHREAINAAFCMGVGGSFDVASGRLKRAPKIVQKMGTEFLFQLITEPHKRWPRQKVYFPFMLRVIGEKFFGSDMITGVYKGTIEGKISV